MASGSGKSSGFDKPSSDRERGSERDRRGARERGDGGRGTRRGRWSTAELAWLRENFVRRRDEVLERELGRPIESIRRMLPQIFRGPRVTGEWSADEDAMLREGLGI